MIEVTLEQMVTALLAAVENPARGIKVVKGLEIRLAIIKAAPTAEFSIISKPRLLRRLK
jgi:hypothetical protein